MFSRLSAFLYRVSTGRVALVALVIFILFTATVLPAQSKKAEETTGDTGSPDLSLFYSKADLYGWADAYGEAGRQEYVRSHFTFDVAWPLVYTFFLVTAISWLYARAYPSGGWPRLANLAPFLAMLFDFLENIATSWVMLRYPDPAPFVAAIAPIFTPLKWLFVVGCFLLVVFGVAAAIWRRQHS